MLVKYAYRRFGNHNHKVYVIKLSEDQRLVDAPISLQQRNCEVSQPTGTLLQRAAKSNSYDNRFINRSGIPYPRKVFIG